jgi:hypothetical protein
MYGECILFWMLENVIEGYPVEDFEMQEGSGLPDFEFEIGMGWLMKNELLDHRDSQIH